MVQKSGPKSNPKLVEDERWKVKGGPMKIKKERDVRICPVCNGLDWDCPRCGGEGVVDK